MLNKQENVSISNSVILLIEEITDIWYVSIIHELGHSSVFHVAKGYTYVHLYKVQSVQVALVLSTVLLSMRQISLPHIWEICAVMEGYLSEFKIKEFSYFQFLYLPLNISLFLITIYLYYIGLLFLISCVAVAIELRVWTGHPDWLPHNPASPDSTITTQCCE